jgi:succinoglycan biosynthesis transport protein ExoP
MSNLPTVPPQDPGFQLGAPMEVSTTVTPAPKFRIKKYLFFLRRFWWIPLITLILALGGAVAKFKYTPPEFTSFALMLEAAKLQLGQGASFDQDEETYFGNMTSVFQSDMLRQAALERLKAANPNSIALDKDGNPMGIEVDIFQFPRSSVFKIQATSASHDFTPVYLNALVNSYLDFTKNSREALSGETLNSISTQIAQYEQESKSDQAILNQFEQSNNIVVLEQESQVAGSELAKLKTQMADYNQQSNLLNAVALDKSNILSKESTNMADPLFQDLIGGNSVSSPVTQSQNAYQQIETLKFQREKLSKNLRPDHPKIVELDKQIAEAQDMLDFYSTQNQNGIDTARQELKIRMDSAQSAINLWEAKVDYDSARIAQSDALKAKVARDQSMFDRLSSLMDNVNLTEKIDQDPLTVLQPASDASRSYGKLKSNLSTAAFGGLAAGLAIVLLIAIRDDRFASLVEVAERIGDNVVGQVPEIPELSRGVPLAMLGDNDDQHMYIESYRSLRSALLYFAVDGVRPKVLLITSAVPNEGKSTIASNLSCAMALGGSRVLLIDGDLRKGRLHDLLGLQSKPGLAELLLTRGDVDKFIQASPMPNLSFIARGSGQRNPGDLFLTNFFDETLAKLKERYDYIIIDSSPVFAADDSTTLAPKVDGTLFVVRSRFSRSGIVKEALDLLYQRHATVLGLILNRIDASNRSYHYYKYSEYHTSDD